MQPLEGKKTIAMEEIDIFGYADQGDYQDEQIDQVEYLSGPWYRLVRRKRIP